MMKKNKTAAELWAELESDPEYQRNRRKLEALRERTEKEVRIAEAPLVEALATTGTKVSSVWDLVNTKARYPPPCLYCSIISDGHIRTELWKAS